MIVNSQQERNLIKTKITNTFKAVSKEIANMFFEIAFLVGIFAFLMTLMILTSRAFYLEETGIFEFVYFIKVASPLNHFILAIVCAALVIFSYKYKRVYDYVYAADDAFTKEILGGKITPLDYFKKTPKLAEYKEATISLKKEYDKEIEQIDAKYTQENLKKKYDKTMSTAKDMLLGLQVRNDKEFKDYIIMAKIYVFIYVTGSLAKLCDKISLTRYFYINQDRIKSLICTKKRLANTMKAKNKLFIGYIISFYVLMVGLPIIQWIVYAFYQSEDVSIQRVAIPIYEFWNTLITIAFVSFIPVFAYFFFRIKNLKAHYISLK